MTVSRLLLLLANGVLLAQAATSYLRQAAVAKASVAVPPTLGVLPAGKGVALAELKKTNWKSDKAPAWVAKLAMPKVEFKQGTTAAMQRTPLPLKAEMQKSGVVKAMAAALKLPESDEPRLAAWMETAVMKALAHQDAPRGAAAAKPGRRLLDFWDDIANELKKAGCAIFASGAVVGYLAAYAWFHGCNSGYEALISHQKFFQRSIYSQALLGKVKIKYSACFPPGFESADATTMGSEIYVRGARANIDTNAITTMSLSSAFQAQTRLLIHELAHSRQYEIRGWNIGTFGWDYMYQYCMAGMSYSNNVMEKEGEANRPKADSLMINQGVSHYKKWRKDALAVVVGSSMSQKEYTNFKIGTTSIMSIDLTKGTTKGAESQRKAGTNCVRVVLSSQLSQRTAANIPGAPFDCVNLPPTPKPTQKPTAPTPKPTLKPGTTAQPTFKPIARR